MERVLALTVNGLAWLTGFQPLISDQLSTSLSTSFSIPGVIPGQSNLKFCAESTDRDLFQIERLEVTPTPPLVEENISIYIYGTFLSDISDDPTWDYYVREIYSDSPGISGTLAFCDAMENIEQPDANRQRECPPRKGFAIISIYSWVPWFVGEGNFTVQFNAKTKEGERIYCVDGEFELKYPERNPKLEG